MTIAFRRDNREKYLFAKTTSIGATPVAAMTVAPAKGRIVRTFAVSEGASTGTISVAVIINAGSEIGTPLSFTGGSGVVGSDTIKAIGAAARVNEGDLITFTPSGGGGATIPGLFCAVLRVD